jgi:hypothetical protein
MRIEGKHINGKRPPERGPDVHAPCTPGVQRLFPGRPASRRS